jgi:hypothetical protein
MMASSFASMLSRDWVLQTPLPSSSASAVWNPVVRRRHIAQNFPRARSLEAVPAIDVTAQHAHSRRITITIDSIQGIASITFAVGVAISPVPRSSLRPGHWDELGWDSISRRVSCEIASGCLCS